MDEVFHDNELLQPLSSGEKNFEAFKAWRASLADEDFKQIVFRGSLNRTEVAKGCGIAKSALRQNPKIKVALELLEKDLRGRGVLPPLTQAAEEKKEQPKQYDRQASKRIIDSKRVAELEQEVIELKARLKRLQELSEVTLEMGVQV